MTQTAEVLDLPNNDEPEQPQKLGAMIDALYEIREERKKLDAKSKVLSGQMEELQAKILEKQDEEGTTFSGGKLARATVTETIVPDIEDWDEFYQYIKDNDAFYLLQRRPAATSYREMIEAGETIPGTKPITKRSVSLRKL